MDFISHKKAQDIENKMKDVEKSLGELELDIIFKNEVEDVNRRVTNLQTDNTFTFAFFTDTHVTKSRYEMMKKHFANVKKLSERGQLDFICHGGDVTDGRDKTKKPELDRLNKLMNQLKSNEIPTFVLFGNHDEHSFYDEEDVPFDELVTKDEWYQHAIRPLKNNAIHDENNKKSSYYYYDFTDKKVRVICLDAVDFPYKETENGNAVHHGRSYWGFRDEQLQWLAHQVLKEVPEDYKILLLSHMAHDKKYSIYDRTIENGKLVEGILQAYTNGESYKDTSTDQDEETVEIDVSYEEQGEREIIAMVYGHSHVDGMFKTSDTGLNFPLLTLSCSVPTEREREGHNHNYHDVEDLQWATVQEREEGTLSEDAWDVFTINLDNGNIAITRFGVGDDREIDY